MLDENLQQQDIPEQIGRIKISRGIKNGLESAASNILTQDSIFVASHLHTIHSGFVSTRHPIPSAMGLRYYDSVEGVYKWVDYATHNGINSIVITDHDNQDALSEAREKIENENLPLIAIPGVELSLGAGHTLMLNQELSQVEIDYIRRRLSKAEWKDKEFIAFCNEYRQKGAYIIPAHPLDPRLPYKLQSEETWRELFGLEFMNSGVLANFTLNQIEKRMRDDNKLDEEKALLIFAGSDAHRVKRNDILTQIHLPVKDNINYRRQKESSTRIMELLAGGLADGTKTSAMNENLTMHFSKTPGIIRAVQDMADTVVAQFQINPGLSALRLIIPGLLYLLNEQYRKALLNSYDKIV
jgi:predicted metal-dependent phosphoesterase TrpH